MKNLWNPIVAKYKSEVRGYDDITNVLFSEFSSFAIDQKKTVMFGLVAGYVIIGKKFDDLKEELAKEFPKFFNLIDGEKYRVYVNTDVPEYYILKQDGYSSGERWLAYFYTFDHERLKTFRKIGKQYLVEKTENSVFMLTFNQESGYDFTNIGEINSPFTPENYDNHIVKSFNYISDNILQKNNHGKLVVLSGPCGTGKSYFIRGLIEKISKESVCVILPASLINELDGPKLVPLLIEKSKGSQSYDEGLDEYVYKSSKPLVFIAEDCDHYLVPREGADSSLISGLLNYTDGIMSDLLNIRFIATTNAPHLEIDAALKRPGRLLQHCLIGDLSKEKANEIYQRLTEGKGTKVFKEEASLAGVYAEANNLETYDPLIEERKKHKVGFGG